MLPLLPAASTQAPVHATVVEHRDQWTNSARAVERFQEQGAEATLQSFGEALNLKPGIFCMASFSTEIEGYAAWQRKHRKSILDWVGEGNVLAILVQTDQTQPSPDLIPDTLKAVRNDADYGRVEVQSHEHPLVRGLPASISVHDTRTSWETFTSQTGFHVIVTTAQGDPVLMEAAHGKGRIILSALALDKTISPADQLRPGYEQTAKTFFANLVNHAESVMSGEADVYEPSLSPETLRQVAEDSFSIAILPDTQVYAERYPGIFDLQTAWLRSHHRRLNIRYVLHLGDITNRNTPEQWMNARRSYNLIEGIIPYVLVGGNHDYGPGGNAKTRDTYMNDYFPFDRYSAQPGFGGAYEEGKIDNTYFTLEGHGQKWLILGLEWGPRDEVLAWADGVMERHKDHRGILITHAHMYFDETRYNFAKFGREQSWNPHAYGTEGGVNDGQEVWDKLLKKHDFAFAINGHVLGDGAAYLPQQNQRGGTTHQMLMNYQMRQLGGEGYLRIMEFTADNRVRIKAYSPMYDRFLLSPAQSFELELGSPAALSHGHSH